MEQVGDARLSIHCEQRHRILISSCPLHNDASREISSNSRLGTHRTNRLLRRADEDDALLLEQLGEFGVLVKDAVRISRPVKVDLVNMSRLV
jgi:hypothetical protein